VGETLNQLPPLVVAATAVNVTGWLAPKVTLSTSGVLPADVVKVSDVGATRMLLTARDTVTVTGLEPSKSEITIDPVYVPTLSTLGFTVTARPTGVSPPDSRSAR